MNRSKHSGFTLIELLIVVAIIGILAAIAVPNFLNAQVRAKIARTQSDMKSLGTALEMYRLDQNDYPSWHNAIAPGRGDYTHPNEIRFYRLTTPVSYIASVPRDPFATYANQADFDTWGWAYDYVNNYAGDHAGGWGHVWRLNSWGPDNMNNWGGQRDGQCIPGVGGHPNFVYQTSNGLNSYGDVVWVGAKDSLTTNYCDIQNGV